MSGIKTSSNILLSNAAGYAEFLGKRADEFEKIEGSGYGYFWFPQCFYIYWQERRDLGNLELWGNMCPHHVTNRTWQFSEVMRTQDEAHYRSDIFILTPFVKNASSLILLAMMSKLKLIFSLKIV